MSYSPEQVVRSFYQAMGAGDVDSLRRVVSETFADSATLARPESLPGGGVLNGAAAIVRFLERAAGKAPLTVDDVVVADDGQQVFATVTIVLGGNKTTALEKWVFDAGRVVSIRAFYWDTAAMLGGA
jgi:ketosteroid isomerase-like protein